MTKYFSLKIAKIVKIIIRIFLQKKVLKYLVVWINLLYYSYYMESCGVSLAGVQVIIFGFSLFVCQSLESGSGCPCLSSFSLFSSSLIFSSSSLSVLVSSTRLVITMLIESENRNLDRSLRAMPSVSCA